MFKLDKNVPLRNITLLTNKDSENIVGYFLSDLSKYPDFDPNRRGRYNGYVILAQDHPLAGERDIIGDYDVHGGITFANKLKDFNIDPYPELWRYADNWVVGFDTAHGGDTALNWDFVRTKDETVKLLNLMANVSEYNAIDLRGITKTIFFKIKGDDNIYFYDGIEEVLFKIKDGEVIKSPPMVSGLELKIKILHKY